MIMAHRPAGEEEQHLAQALEIAAVCTRRLLGHVGPQIDLESVEGAARLGALTALRGYDPTRGTSLTTWIFHQVRYAIAQELREQDHLKRRWREHVKALWQSGEEEPSWCRTPLSIDDPASFEDEGDGMPDRIRDVIAAQEVLLENAVTQSIHTRWLYALLDQLPELEARVLYERYHEGCSIKEVGRHLDLSRSTVQRLQLQGRMRLREILEGMDWSPEPESDRDA